MTKDEFFVPENEQPNPKEYVSPGGKYVLKVTTYRTGEGTWSYTRGQVCVGDKLVADVKRNYSRFPFAWAESHPDGHDYLVCGEDYQGQTVCQLDTGVQVSTQDTDRTRAGWGFCWSEIIPNPNKTVLAVDGCYWGAPYEIVLFDFTNPMVLPHPELARIDSFDTEVRWNEDGSMDLRKPVEYRKSDGVQLDKLRYEERIEAYEKDDIEERDEFINWNPLALVTK